MNIQTEAFLNDTGCQVSVLYGLIRDVISETREAIANGTLVERAHKLRGAFLQLYVVGPIIYNLTSVETGNVEERSLQLVKNLLDLEQQC